VCLRAGCVFVGWMCVCGLDVCLRAGCMFVGWMCVCGLDVCLWAGCVFVGWIHVTCDRALWVLIKAEEDQQ